jgi:hypothetical protein
MKKPRGGRQSHHAAKFKRPMQRSYNHVPRPAINRTARPAANQPGTLAEQLEAIGLYLANPFRRIDRDAAWQLARRLAISHARGGSQS